LTRRPSAGQAALRDKAGQQVGVATLTDAAGTSLVIHAQPDDEKTDPTGNSDARIACGVNTRS
jgi:Cu-Zn family superoxide dismutase